MTRTHTHTSNVTHIHTNSDLIHTTYYSFHISMRIYSFTIFFYYSIYKTALFHTYKKHLMSKYEQYQIKPKRKNKVGKRNRFLL